MWPCGIGGDYFRLHGAIYPVDVTFVRNGVPVEQIAGMESGTWMRLVGGFDRIDIVNGANAQTVKVIIGRGEGGVDRIMGEVSVIDGGKARTIAGSAYSGYAGCAAAAANYPHVQLWNPVGSGKNVFLESFLVSCSSAALVTAGTYGVALANVITPASSKKYGGPASVAVQQYQNNAAMISGNLLMGQQLQASQNLTINFREPVVLVPGSGMVIGAQTQNCALTASFEYFEEA